MELGILGAGRLGSAVARAWVENTAGPVVLWSPRGPRDIAVGDHAAHRVSWLRNVAGLFEAEYVFCAVSGRSFREVLDNCPSVADFRGTFLCGAPELDLRQLLSLVPLAKCVRVSSFLLGGSISLLVFAEKSACEESLAVLKHLGDVDVAESEELFASLTLLGSPFPVVVAYSLKRFVQDVFVGEDQVLARRVLFRGIRALLRDENRDDEQIVITPGGITEQALKRSGQVEGALKAVLGELKRAVEERSVQPKA
jgi:pyrroline-5-carboxylate reductase